MPLTLIENRNHHIFYRINKVHLAVFLIFTFAFSALSQSGIIIPLNRVLHEEEFAKKMIYSSHKDSTVRLIGGDYSDADAEFTIVLWDADNNGRYDEYYTDKFIIAPYKSDSVVIFPQRNCKDINYYKTCIIRIGTKEYQVTIQDDGHSVEITKIFGNYLEPDIEFFDRIPENPYINLFGDSVSLSAFEHKNKLIYIDFWEASTENTLLVHDSLRDIYNKYKDNLTMVSLDYADTDRVKVRNLVSRNHYDWEHGFTDFNFRWFFIQTLVLFRRPYGALFNSNGKLVKLFELDSPKNLEMVLKDNIGK